MAAQQSKNEVFFFEGARLAKKNFKGERRQYNEKGKRNFLLLLDSKQEEMMINKGVKVKYLRPLDEDDDPQAFVKVNVKYPEEGQKGSPPTVVLIRGGNKESLDADSVDVLDFAEVENWDISVRPYRFEGDAGPTVTLYLKALYATMVEDIFTKKYYGTPDNDEDDFDEDDE